MRVVATDGKKIATHSKGDGNEAERDTDFEGGNKLIPLTTHEIVDYEGGHLGRGPKRSDANGPSVQ